MKTIQITIVGPQGSDPIELVRYMAFRYKTPVERTSISQYFPYHAPHVHDSDSILECSIVIEPGVTLLFQAPVHAIWYLSSTYQYLLAHTDIMIHMLCALREHQQLNIRDFKILSAEYTRLTRIIPYIPVLNDFHCGCWGGKPPDNVAPDEVQDLCLHNVGPIVTTLRMGEHEPICAEGAETVLEQLLTVSHSLSQHTTR